MASINLVKFLADRLNEDEAVAKGLLGATRILGRGPDFYGAGGPAAEAYWQHFDTGRTLADADARCALILEHPITTNIVGYGGGEYSFGCETCHDQDGVTLGDGYCTTLLLLAHPYAAHPDYCTEWKVAL